MSSAQSKVSPQKGRKSTTQPTSVRSNPPPHPSPEPSRAAGPKVLQAKWGAELIAAGWVALPSIILERQEALGLDSMDINIILHIAKHWFEPGNLPHPSKGSIAKAMQVTPRAVQKRLAALENLGFLKRIERRGEKGTKGSQTSEFDLGGLIKEARVHAVAAMTEREKIRQMKLERLRRKRVVAEELNGGEP